MSVSSAPSNFNDTALPEGSTVERLRVSSASSESPALHQVLDSSQGMGVALEERIDTKTLRDLKDVPPADQGWNLLRIPCEMETQAELASQVRETLLQRGDQSERTVTVISLQGAHLICADGWVAVIAPADRLLQAGEAALEASYHASEIRFLEERLAEGWSDLREAAPQAFETSPPGFERRAAIQERFLELVEWRGRHSRLGPKLMDPQVYPPTLTSQIGERVRDRMKLIERWELVDGHLESYEDIYQMCGERISEYGNSRKVHFLEWLIIAILGVQTVLWIVESLSKASET